ncbi:hypothetical protein G7046_g7037 [Stylonectria norvegica]|nr:hypothetical protein G7046_g7037 [Stylonectria norvegica]
MQRSGSYSRLSPPSTSQIPPSQTRSMRSPSPRGRGQAHHPPSHERSVSKSRSRSRPTPRSTSTSPQRAPKHHQHQHQHQHNEHHQNHDDDHQHHHGLFKTSAGLIAGIGLATILAHKAWPKGVIHGGQEEWETRPDPRKEKHNKREPRESERHERRDERVVERTKTSRGGRGGEVVYYEEVVPVRKAEGRRRDLEARGFERVGRPAEDDKMRRPGRLPYPEHAYPDERYYSPERARVHADPANASGRDPRW